MKKKKIKFPRTTMLLSMVLCLLLFSVPVFAKGDNDTENSSTNATLTLEPLDTDNPLETDKTLSPDYTMTDKPKTSKESVEDIILTPEESVTDITITSEDSITDIPFIPDSMQDPLPLTPEGNLTLVDDIDGEQSQEKQFVTMQSKNGNFFYLVIDRSGDKENVYFLNLVDESDLMALIEDAPTTTEIPTQCDSCTVKCETGMINTTCTVCSIDMTKCKGTPLEPIESIEPIEPIDSKNTDGNPSVLFIILSALGIIGGFGYYYFKILKPKYANKGNTNLDEYDYEENQDEYNFENTDNMQEEHTMTNESEEPTK